MSKGNNLSGKEIIIILIPVALFFWYKATHLNSSPEPATQAQSVKVANQPKQIMLKKGSLLCFVREDWEKMKGYIVDQNYQGMRILFDEAKCQNQRNTIPVLYLDPVGKNEALIQMPSGKGAYVFTKDISE